MGMLTLTYLFAGEPPASSVLVERIRGLASEAMTFDEELGVLACPVMGDEVWLLAVERDGARGYTVYSTALGGAYLVDATVAVLRAAGGSGPAPWHDVSGQSWQDAQLLYPRWVR
jgi:hypothetical protein